MIVVDTNVIAYLLIPGGRSPQARDALRADSHWAAPLLWRSEFRNVLWMYARKGDLTLQDAVQLAEEAESLLQGAEFQISSASVLRLAVTSRRSAYDCEFVALARELGVPLVTADRKLAAEFAPTAVSLDAFVS